MTNPYVPPQAELESNQTLGYQEMKYWSAKGRIGRLRYLAYSVGGYIILILVAMLIGGVLGFLGNGSIAGVAGMATSIPYFVFTILLAIRRAHDMNWSGWTVFLLLIPLVGLLWLFKSGSPGVNQFGLPPPPNTLGVKILAFGAPVLMVVLIFAVALPAYQGYLQRTQAMQRQ
jgi:uncharacterized membrane protein YhaH (DUF805 family)